MILLKTFEQQLLAVCLDGGLVASLVSDKHARPDCGGQCFDERNMNFPAVRIECPHGVLPDCVREIVVKVGTVGCPDPNNHPTWLYFDVQVPRAYASGNFGNVDVYVATAEGARAGKRCENLIFETGRPQEEIPSTHVSVCVQL